MTSVYQILKILHFFGFIAAIGSTIAGTVAYRYFWQQYKLDRTRVNIIFNLIQGVQVAGMIGMITLLLAGFSMLAISQVAFVSLLWFQIKLGLVVLLFASGLTLGRKTALELKRLVEQAATSQPQASDAIRIKKWAQLFSIIQLTLFSAIVILSILKVN